MFANFRALAVYLISNRLNCFNLQRHLSAQSEANSAYSRLSLCPLRMSGACVDLQSSIISPWDVLHEVCHGMPCELEGRVQGKALSCLCASSRVVVLY